MTDYVTKTQLDKALAKQTNEIIDVLHTFMEQVDQRFNKVEQDIADFKEIPQ